MTDLNGVETGAGGGTAVTSYGYDVQDHLTSVTDAEGTTTTYTFSDRDLMTEEVSPVSGATVHTYDAHGSLETSTDARSVTVTRIYDVADRVTFLDYPDPTLDTTFTYDDPGVPFSKGRLTAITRDGLSVDYAYDRFGRTTQDGELTYAYDKNGNRTEIGYPGGEVARYTHDFADREATLEFEPAAGSPETVVTSASYYSRGPLSSVELDYCRCVHESTHVSLGLDELHGTADYTTYYHECEAYLEQILCLLRYKQ